MRKGRPLRLFLAFVMMLQMLLPVSLARADDLLMPPEWWAAYVTDGHGTPLTEIPRDATVWINYEFQVPDEIDLVEGAPYTLTMLPDGFWRPGLEVKDLRDLDGTLLATAAIQTNGLITITFTQEAAELSNVQGRFYLQRRLDKSQIGSQTEIVMNAGASGMLTIPIAQPPVINATINKADGLYNPATGEITWSVTVDPGSSPVSGLSVVDRPDANQELVVGSALINGAATLICDDDADILTCNFLGEVSTQQVITYRTTVKPQTFGLGTLNKIPLHNSADLVVDGDLVATSPASYNGLLISWIQTAGKLVKSDGTPCTGEPGDPGDCKVEWSITVNPDGHLIPIGATVTDQLPQLPDYLVYEPGSWSLKVGTGAPQALSDDLIDGTRTFRYPFASATTDVHVFTFRTQIKPEYYSQQAVLGFQNTATLVALDGANVPSTATVTADQGTGGLHKTALLAALDLSEGALQPAFAPETTSYAVSIPRGWSPVFLTPTLADEKVSLEVDGVPGTDGGPHAVTISQTEKTTVVIQVIAEDTTTKKSYQVTFWPEPAFTGAEQNGYQLVSQGGNLAPLLVDAPAGATLRYDVAGDLPDGIDFDPETGTFSGTVMTVGESTASITVTDAFGGTATNELTVVVQAGPVLATAQAGTFATLFVNTTADFVKDDGCQGLSNDCSLRAAIRKANATPGSHTIIIPPGTFTLTLEGRDENAALTGDLDILDHVTLIGANGNRDGDPTQTIIQAGATPGSGIDKVFSVNPNLNTPIHAAFEALTIRHGYNTSDPYVDGYGGALDFEGSGAGSLRFYNVIFDANETTRGEGGALVLSNIGGASVLPVPISIEKTIFTGNKAGLNGGAIWLSGLVPLTMTDSVLSGNIAGMGGSGSGGGIYHPLGSDDAPLTIRNTMIVENQAPGGDGGGLLVKGRMIMENSTIAGNLAQGQGGGLYAGLDPGVQTLSNVTISGNTATNAGGGIYVVGSAHTMTLKNVTVTQNRTGVSTGGGGLFAVTMGTVLLHNSIVAGNLDDVTADDVKGILDMASSHNLFGTGGSGELSATQGNLVGRDPLLGPLQDNGGGVHTHALLPGSPAIDAGTNAQAAGPYDARGVDYHRILDGPDVDVTATVDIGAYEAHPTVQPIADLSVGANGQITVIFHVGDGNHLNSVVATSNNASLLSNAGLVIKPGADPGQRILEITPEPGQEGTATVTVTVSDVIGGRTHTAATTFTVTVFSPPDFAVTKSHVGNFRQGQEDATYTVQVTNIGSSPTDGSKVTLTENLPVGLSLVSITGSAPWTCTGNVCETTSALNPGVPYTFTVHVKVAPDASATLTSSVTVAGGGVAAVTVDDPTTIEPVADLTVTKSHDGAFQQGQTDAKYTILVTNAGKGDTVGVVSVTEQPPSGLTVTSMSGEGWNCIVASLSCTTTAVLKPTKSYKPITVVVTVARNLVGPVTNQAVVAGGGELNETNNTANDETDIQPMPDLTVVISQDPSFRQGGAGSFHITVSNEGFAATTGEAAVQVTMDRPGLEATEMSADSDWICDVRALRCTSTLAVGESLQYPTITLAVDVAPNATGTVRVTTEVTGGGQLPARTASQYTDVVIIPAPDLTVSKTHVGAFTQGGQGTYTITVQNSGAGPTAGTVTMVASLPAGLTADAAPANDTGWSCTLSNADQTVSCERDDVLAPGLSYGDITLRVNVDAFAPPEPITEVEVSGGGELAHTLTDNTNAVPTPIDQLPDLVVSATHEDPFRQGQQGAAYTILVENTGTGLTSGQVTVTATVPTALAPDMLLTGGTGWACTATGQTVECTRSDALAAGLSYEPITLVVNVADTAPNKVTLNLVVAGGNDSHTGNNTFDRETTITQVAMLTIAKSHTDTFRQGARGLTYTILVGNAGDGATTGKVEVVDTLPTGLRPQGVGTGGDGWTCDVDGQRVTCDRSDSLAGQGATYDPITIVVDVADDAPAEVTNQAQVSGGGALSPKTASDVTIIIPVPDLTVSMTHAHGLTQGEKGALYTIVVENVGDGPTHKQVDVTLTLPAALRATALSGTGWNCDEVALTCHRSDPLGKSPPGYEPITLTVDVDDAAEAELEPQAQVSGGGDLNLANNQTTDPTQVVQLPDLVIAMTHATSFTKGQIGAKYEITVTNIGRAATANTVTVVVDELPEKLTATHMEGDGWTCDLKKRTCTRDDVLVAGGSYPTITLTVDVDRNAPDSVINKATVSVPGEVIVGNNTATVTTTTVSPSTPPSPDTQRVSIGHTPSETREATLTVSGTANPHATITVHGRTVRADSTGHWSVTLTLQEGPNVITATNQSASDSVTVVLDTIPPVLTLVASATETESDTVVLTAASEEGAIVTIEGHVGTRLTVSLALGANHFTATANDRAGNVATATVTVVRKEPKSEEPEPEAPAPETAPGQNEPPELTDIERHWARTNVDRMVQMGVITGYADATFRPEAEVTRLEFAVMISRLLGLTAGEGPLSFTDSEEIPGWAAKQVAAAAEAGIILGRSNGQFDPHATVTRAEVCIMLVRSLAYAGHAIDWSGDASFADAPTIPSWAIEQVLAAAQHGLVRGYEDGTFRAGQTTTRGEAATMLTRLLDLLLAEPDGIR